MTKFAAKSCLGAMIIIMVSLVAAPVLGQVVPPSLQIDLKGQAEALPKGKVLRKSWIRACNRIGEGMLLEKGPFGYGAFESYSCFLAGKKVSGTSVAKQSGWKLSILANTGGWKFELQSPTGEKGALFTEANLTVPHSSFNLRYLADPEFADMIAYGLLDQSPLAMLINPKSLKGKSKNLLFSRFHRITRQTKFSVPPPPEQLKLYRVKFDEEAGLWLPTMGTDATRKKITLPRTTGKRRGKGRVIYGIKGSLNGAMWAQNAAGAGKLQGEIEAAIETAHGRMEKVLKTGYLEDYLTGRTSYLGVLVAQSASSGFIGGRYGLQVQPGDSLLKGTSLIGALVEVRGGPASGLRYYFDAVPRQETTENFLGKDVDLYIEWTRHVLGMGFGLDIDFFINWFDVIPKVGMMNFKANLATKRDEDGNLQRFQEFTTENTIAFELDLGMERRTDNYTLRLWYAYGQGLALEKDQAALTSQKFGIDTFLRVGPTMGILSQEFKLAILLFYNFESVLLTAPDEVRGESETPPSNDDIIATITYTGGYAGAGLALSW